MNEVNLDDLKIEHKEPAKAKRFPLGLVVIVFLIGAFCCFGVLYLKPSLLPRGEERKMQSRGADPIPTGNPNTEPDSNSGMPDDEAALESFTEGGWIEVPSYHPVIVSALIPGRLERLNVLEGSRVNKGDVIALLYDKDLKDALDRAAAEQKVAEANLARLKAGFRTQEVGQARAEVEAAQADMVLKEQILKRTEQLLETGAVSAEELDRDKAAFRIAKAKLETLRQEMLLKEEGYRVEEVQAAEAELARRNALLALAKKQVEYAGIKSPISGVVLERFVTPGTYIPAGNPRIVSLYDPNDLQVRVDVRQEHIGGVYLGQSVEVVTDAEPGRTYTGEVIRIEPLADFKKNTIQAKIRLLETSENLHPEMIARIRFLRSEND